MGSVETGIDQELEQNIMAGLDLEYGGMLEGYEADGYLKTIFDCPQKYNVKHRLNTTWQFIYTRPSKNWEEGIINLGEAYTIEDFFSFYHRLRFSELNPFYAINIFREGSQPSWEHESNKDGKRTRIVCKNQEEENVFKVLAMMCIGEVFGLLGRSINGIKLEKKEKYVRIEIWYLKSISDTEIDSVQAMFEAELGERLSSIERSAHQDLRRKGGHGRRNTSFKDSKPRPR